SHNNYSFVSSNDFLKSKDSILYAIHVIPDLYPTISVEQQRDSFSTKQIFFKGVIKDDYGFKDLKFVYKYVNSPDAIAKSSETFSEVIKINKTANQEQFFYYWDLNQMNIDPGDYLEYYFEVWDNDGVNGSKSARSQSKLFKAPSLRELAQQSDKRNDDLKKDLEETIKKSKEIQEKIDDASKRLLNKKELNYDDRKRIEDLLKQHKEVEQVVKNMQNQNQQNQQMKQEYKKFSPEIAEKQSQLQELFEKLMSEEMKEKMAELEKLLSEMNKDKVQKMLEDMKFDEKSLEEEMDRTLELFKQLEMEQKLNELTENLDELAKKQEELAQKSEDGKENSEDLKEKQDQLNKEFDDLKKDLDEIEKENDDLEFPAEISDTEKEEESIGEEMQNSSEQLDKNKKSKASQSQKKAAQEMKQMAQKIQQGMQAGAQEQMSEDLEALRALLENLIKFSFDQEALMDDIKKVNINDPKYVVLSQTQRKLKDDAQVLKDSLYALSRRVFQIQSTVNREIASINQNIESSIGLLQDRKKEKARSEQQYVMTSVNNLALLLSEAMQQMQEDMAEGMPGSQQCSKPGGKPGSTAGQMKKLQEQLNKQIEAMKKGMEKGKGKEKGEKPGQGGKGGMSEQLARMAAQQEAIRNEMQKLNQLQNKDGKGSLGNLDELAKKMEETETDLVNKRITQETLKRQEEILTRLLEAEKAERERELDNKRESAEPDQHAIKSPSNFEEYKKLKMREVELLKTIPPTLNPFYKNLVNYYFQSLDNK
ncbi:MAG: DUF4175 domain-containing protein, partial [Bacteroidia bacterium]|nr:DUF4175 domain-containing protein [Bacteroidia bacterium]